METKTKKSVNLRVKPEARQAQLYAQKAQGGLTKTVGIFVLTIFLIHPFFIGPDTYFSITETKQGFFRFCAVTFFFVIFIISITIPGFFRRPDWKALFKEIRIYEWPLIAYAAVMLISTMFADSISLAIKGNTGRNEGILMIWTYLLICVIVGRLFRPREWTLYVLCTTAALVALYGIFQCYGVDFLHLNPPQLDGQIGEKLIFFSTMSNRNVASTYLCLAFCICVGMFSNKTKPAHWAFLPLGLVIFYAQLLTRTESGYVGLFASVALTFPFIAKTRQSAARFLSMMAGCLGTMWIETTVGLTDPIFLSYWTFARPYLLPAMAVLLVASAVFYFVKLPAVSTKSLCILWYTVLVVLVIIFLISVPKLAEATQNTSLDELSSILQGDFQDHFMSGRMMVWKRAVSMMPDRLLFGYGPDNFSQSFNALHRVDVEAAQGQVYDKLHNEYLQTLFDNGLLGLLGMLSFYGSLIWAARKKLQNPMVLAILMALLCHMVQAFFNFVSPFAHPVAWTLWGVLGALIYENESEITESKNTLNRLS